MGRTPCCDKNNGLKKGPWTPEEDQKLVDYIQKHGYGNWRTLPKNSGLQRCGKSCRLRWTNYLRPDIKRGRFSFEEEETIIQLHSILGNKWSAIAARLPGRTDNEIKNYWNTHIKKRLLRMGIDPVTHNPRLDLLDLSSILRSTLYNSSQINLSRLLGVEPLLNPELLKLAASLMQSSSQCKSQTLSLQKSSHENLQFSSNCLQHQQQDSVVEAPQQEIVQYLGDSKFEEPMPNGGDYLNELQNSAVFAANDHITQECLNFPCCDFDYYELDQSYETSTLNNSDNSDQKFSFMSSILSSPSSSSPTATATAMMSSNSTYFTSSTEDERESYCSDDMYLNFEIHDIFNGQFL